jgi:hypothetical protein
MNSELYKKISHTILAILFVGIIVSCFTFQYRVVQNLSFRDKININSNQEGFTNAIFSKSIKKENKKDKKESDDLIELMNKKLKGLTEEMGGSYGLKELKAFLTNTKKVVNIEGAKCIIDMINEEKGGMSIDINNLLTDDDTDKNIKCKKYTELSKMLDGFIENI